jgi:hypothetical protein
MIQELKNKLQENPENAEKLTFLNRIVDLMGESFIDDHYTENEMRAMIFGYSIGHSTGYYSGVSSSINARINKLYS